MRGADDERRVSRHYRGDGEHLDPHPGGKEAGEHALEEIYGNERAADAIPTALRPLRLPFAAARILSGSRTANITTMIAWPQAWPVASWGATSDKRTSVRTVAAVATYARTTVVLAYERGGIDHTVNSSQY